MSQLKVGSIVDASGGNTATINTYTPTESNMMGKNRIINGDMRIDQRNAGASVTVNSSANFFGVDRWFATGQGTDGVFTVQQSSTAPAGFKNSLLATVTTSDASIGASQIYVLGQRIEGLNVSDLGWGAIGASSVTLSFWVRSSLTGTFGGCVTNETGYSYPFTYTISAANTFEQKTVTITGPTAGTWLTTTGVGVVVIFTLGSGSTFSGPPNAWASNVYYGATGQTQIMSTNGATFYITGVQLEVGSVATPFERRDYGRELILCQRYFVKETGYNAKIASRYGANLVYLSYTTPVEMRTTPTVANSATNWQVLNTTASENSTTSTVNTVLGYVGGNVDVVLNTSFNPAAYIYIATSSGNANSLTFSSEL
jgi:hypothetical protein